MTVGIELCPDCPLVDANLPQGSKEWAWDNKFEAWRGLPEHYGQGLHPVPLVDRDKALACRARILAGVCSLEKVQLHEGSVAQARQIAHDLVRTDGPRAELERALYEMPQEVLVIAAGQAQGERAAFRKEHPDDIEAYRLFSREGTELLRTVQPQNYPKLQEVINQYPTD